MAVYGGGEGFRVVVGTRDSRVTLLNGDGQRIWEALLDYTVRGLDVTGNGASVVAGDDRGTVYLERVLPEVPVEDVWPALADSILGKLQHEREQAERLEQGIRQLSLKP